MFEFINQLESYLPIITIITLLTLIGIEVIVKVPSMLHTPLMSGTNAISGVTVIGGIYLVRTSGINDLIPFIIGSIAVLIGAINVVGGFRVTQRMLEKFKKENNK